MKKLILTIAASLIALAAVNADKNEEVTVTGAVKCAHCDLAVKSSCQQAIQTADKAIYLLDGAIAEKFFEENEGVKSVTATGTAKKDGENTVLKASKIAAAKS